ncbi:MAG: hypothetical protein KDC84_10885 [Crocinitomicaceae bacterium]|nr:hypothetical protein [Crocinitomicaceae bacterium]
MKIRFVIILLCFFPELWGQHTISDSLLLAKIFGSTDPDGQTFTCIDCKDESMYSYQDEVVFKIVFKSEIVLDEEALLLVIAEAPYGTQHGHQFGYQHLYFFKRQDKDWSIVDSIVMEDLTPIGDQSEFSIVDIGKNKKALISTFQSTGNHHLETTLSIDLIERSKLTFLFSINAEYSNLAFMEPVSVGEDCPGESYEETYEIIPSDSEWYEIRVHRKEFAYSRGCRDAILKLDVEKRFFYFEEKYLEQK